MQKRSRHLTERKQSGLEELESCLKACKNVDSAFRCLLQNLGFARRSDAPAASVTARLQRA